MICTFLDAGVLIAGIRGDPATVERVLEILNDPERAFAASDFVRLEVLPKALYFRQQAEAAFYEAYFATVVEMVEVSQRLWPRPTMNPSVQGWPVWMRCTLLQRRMQVSRSLSRLRNPRSLYSG